MRVALVVLLGLVECAGERSDSSVEDMVAGMDAAVDVADIAADEGAPRARADGALCSKMWSRLVDCGHYYTFPEFEDRCGDWDAGGPERATLDGCKLKPCATLVSCVKSLLDG
ncbi:MAG: hypothetical protein AMXMBFR64_07930 [Myxococcales bacterium]